MSVRFGMGLSPKSAGQSASRLEQSFEEPAGPPTFGAARRLSQRRLAISLMKRSNSGATSFGPGWLPGGPGSRTRSCRCARCPAGNRRTATCEWRGRWPAGCFIHRKTVVLAGDHHHTSVQVLHRVVGAVVAMTHFQGLGTGGQSQNWCPRQIPNTGISVSSTVLDRL